MLNRALEGLLSGRSLGGRYSVHEVIGRGGMSLVYRAVDERLGREVALKIVSVPTEHSRDELRERFRREAAAAARIPPHPNVVQVYDYGTDPELDLDYIVMELFRGADLKALLHDGPVPHELSLRIIREAARGLAAGHRVGIVHRDVKPANIYLTGEDRQVKILDFGIAKALEVEGAADLTRTGHAPHSPAYASPEQLDHRRDLTPASDVFQLGLVAYELLAGERPWNEAQREMARRGAAVSLPPHGRWREVPAEARGVISRALEFDPDRRFADAAAFARALSGEADPALAAAPAPDDEDGTALLAADATIAEAPHEVPVAAYDPPPSGSPPAPAGSTGVTRGWGRAPQLVTGGVLALAGLVLITQLNGDPEEAVTAAGGQVLNEAALDAEFRPLVAEASATLAEEAAEAGAEIAAQVEAVVISLNDAWTRGQLDRHLSYYAEEVNYYNDSRATLDEIRRDRAESLERYDQRTISFGQRAIEVLSPERARVLAEKSWTFRGGDDVMEGAGRQEYVLELRDGEWKVVSEQLVEQYR